MRVQPILTSVSELKQGDTLVLAYDACTGVEGVEVRRRTVVRLADDADSIRGPDGLCIPCEVLSHGEEVWQGLVNLRPRDGNHVEIQSPQTEPIRARATELISSRNVGLRTFR